MREAAIGGPAEPRGSVGSGGSTQASLPGRVPRRRQHLSVDTVRSAGPQEPLGTSSERVSPALGVFLCKMDRLVPEAVHPQAPGSRVPTVSREESPGGFPWEAILRP